MRFMAHLMCLLLAFTASTSFAAKSAKKLAADSISMREPEVVEKGDNSFGLRATQGSAFDGATAATVVYEYSLAPNFGIGALYSYANYDRTYAANGTTGKVETDVNTFGVLGNFHVNLFNVRNMDTYFTGGVVRSSMKGSARIGGAKVSADDDETKLMAYGNLRYFVNSNIGFTACVGTGLGNFGLGMDVLF